jgi:hypothetical protein
MKIVVFDNHFIVPHVLKQFYRHFRNFSISGMLFCNEIIVQKLKAWACKDFVLISDSHFSLSIFGQSIFNDAI